MTALLLALALVASPAPADDLLAAYKRADELPALVRGKALNVTLTPNWIGSKAMWYRAERKGGVSEFMLVDVASGKKGPAFDHLRLAEALAKAAAEKVEAGKLPFTTIAFSEDMGTLIFSAFSKKWEVSLRDYAIKEAGSASLTPQPPLPEGEGERYLDDIDETTLPMPRLGGLVAQQPRQRTMESPDGKWTLEVRDGNLWAKPKSGGDSLQLTKEGGFTTGRWSPGSTHVVGYRLIPGDGKEVFLVSSAPRSGGRATLETRKYDLPGDKLDTYELYLCDLAAKTEIKVAIDPLLGGGQPWAGPPGIDWRGNDRFVVDYADRGYQRYRIQQVGLDGKVTTLVDEQEKTFVDTTALISRFVNETNELIWRSERDGWGHLYLYDASTGALKNQITKGEFVVRSIESIEPGNRSLVFTANGREPGEDPYFIHSYRVNFDGTGLALLNPGKGTHRSVWRTDRAFFIDTWSRVDQAPIHELRKADGSLVCQLEAADVSALKELKLKVPEVFVAKGRDGKTDIWGIVCKPSNFSSRRKYPVIENIYAGPQDAFTPKAYTSLTRMQRLAELGFVVVQIDGMGTRNRGKTFHDVCWKNIVDAGFPDRILWMQALAKKEPAVDITRVGVYGTSAGGQNAATAVLTHPEFYDVAVASCGCHDNRMDKFWWNEQWMGYPVGPHYAEQSNITNAPKLQGRLLLFVGELDHNVPPESTVRLVDALMKAKREFDFMIFPGLDHTDGGEYGERKRRDYFVKWLLGRNPPDWNMVK